MSVGGDLVLCDAEQEIEVCEYEHPNDAAH
jgi:hypothetical protein